MKRAHFFGVLIALTISSLTLPGNAGVHEFQEQHNTATGAREHASDSKLDWVNFQDPFEHAFALEVPQGWTVKGGLFRLGYSDERPMIDLTSPDGKINVRLGDVTVPTYTNPSQFHSREGETYDLGAQAQMTVAKYRTGPEFVVLYSHARFYQSCQNPLADAEDATFTMVDYLPAASDASKSSTGQIAYSCSSGKGPVVAFAFTRTSLYGPSIWQANTLASFTCPADQVSLAQTVLLHGAQSFKLSPEWVEYQKKMDAMALEYQRARQQQRMYALNQQVQQFQAKMSAMQNQVNAFERHQQAQSAQVESFTQALRGVTPTIDPMTGESREVWTGPNSQYWTNGLGQVVNTNSQPSPGWHQLQPQN